MAAWLHNPSGKLEIDGGKGGGATKGRPVPSISKFQYAGVMGAQGGGTNLNI